MKIINGTISLGDGLNTFRVIQALINKFKQEGDTDIEIHWYNGALGLLFPAEKYGAVNVLNSRPLQSDIYTYVNYHDHINGVSNTNRNLDFSAAMAEKYDLDLVGILPEIDVPFDASVPAYDFVIAPYVLNNPGKNVSPQFYQELVDNLHMKYPDYSICVTGNGSMPSEEDLRRIDHNLTRFIHDEDYLRANTSQYLTGVDYFWNKNLQEVAQLLKNTRRLFITPDSGLRWVNTFIKTPSIELYTRPHCLISSHFRDYHDNMRYEKTEPITMEETMNYIEKGLCSL